MIPKQTSVYFGRVYNMTATGYGWECCHLLHSVVVAVWRV